MRTFEHDINGSMRRRGTRLGVLIALIAVIPGLVAGVPYISNLGKVASTGSSQSSSECLFELISNTSDTSKQFGQQWITFAGVDTNSVTVTFNTSEGATYEYLVDEFAAVCAEPASTSTHSITLTETASTASTASTGTVVAIIQGGAATGYSGSQANGIWTATADANKAGTNPTAGTSPCDGATTPALYAPINGGSFTTSTTYGHGWGANWTWSMNATIPAWYGSIYCTSGKVAPPAVTLAAQSAAVSLAFYFFSFAMLNVANTGQGSPSVSFSIQST